MSTASTLHAVAPAALSASEPRTNKWLVAVAVAIGALLEIIDTSIVNVALTDIQTAVGASLAQASWVVSSYGIANVIVLPLTAWLGDRFGKKRYFIFSLIGFTIASVLCGMATSLPMLIVARVLQGLMGGGLLAKAQAFLLETFPREEQPMAQAFFGAIVIAGPAIGPTLGGYIVTNYDWRWIFYVNIPIGIAAVWLCISQLPKDKAQRDTSRVDWMAILLLALGIGCLQTVLEEGNSEDWFDSRFIITLTVLSVVGLVCFVERQLTSAHPVVDLRVLRHRSLWAGSLLSIVVGMALYGALFAVPIFAQTVLHYTPEQTGYMLLPGALASAFMMPIAGKLASRFDPRRVLACGGLVLVLGLWQLTSLSPSTGEGDLFGPLLVRAIGTVMMFLPLNLATLGPIPRSEASAASGFFNLTRQLGGSIGVALLTTLLTTRQSFHRAVLVEKVVSGDALTLERVQQLTARFTSLGFSLEDAHQRALAMLDGIVNQQASVLSFADTFWATAALVLVCLPLVALLGKPARGAKVELGH
ncbi:MAG: Inner rane component of tripartite multidrug resistance system [Myxococcaceae bacterium]|nr:Inner rane component of tripartite multidrug resistance system [Myxococcaceae bacterium]